LIAFVLRRILQGILVMLVVGLIAFSLFNFVGDPVALMLPPEATQADREQMRGALGLDKPFYMQFVTFLNNAVHGNFGISLRLGRPVSTLLVERLPATLELAMTAALIGLFIGIPVGVYTALKRDSWISRAPPHHVAWWACRCRTSSSASCSSSSSRYGWDGCRPSGAATR